jgi:alcohol dehydrogenase class IV
MSQVLLQREEDLFVWLSDKQRVMLVCGSSAKKLLLYALLEEKLKEKNGEFVIFSDFKPNPEYDSVVTGVRLFREKECKAILAIGGGSAMDVAKCIKLYADAPGDGAEGSFLKESSEGKTPFLAIPTTAGSGSEATRFAVIYYQGVKQSITSDSILPDAVYLDGSLLLSLPEYQRKSTMLDALSHAVESYWSVHATDESKNYAAEAIHTILEEMSAYLGNTSEGNAQMLRAAYTAGKAINITKTTAGHAMAYKVTGLFGTAHGHATALINRALYRRMVELLETGNCKVSDRTTTENVMRALSEIAVLLGCNSAREGADKFDKICRDLGLEVPKVSEKELDLLVSSVNPERLQNHPMLFSYEDLKGIYRLAFQD